MKKSLLAAAVTAATLLASTASFAQMSANVSLTSNYLWRGLTQTRDKAALQGGLKYTHKDSGAYVGTWLSNVEFAPGDAYNYENDIFFGISNSINDNLTYDVGYLYYNYNSAAMSDFGEIYGALTFSNFTLKLSMVTDTQPSAPAGMDFGFGDTYYISGDYAIPLEGDFTVGLHAGYQAGDWNKFFNGVNKDYWDYNVSISKMGFTAMISGTNLSDEPGQFATNPDLENDKVKFVISYTKNFDF